MSGPARAAVLDARCRELRLPTARRQYSELVRQLGDDGRDYEEFLLQLLETEVLARRDGPAACLLRGALLPDLKILDQVNWDALRGIELPQLAQLATCDCLERG